MSVPSLSRLKINSNNIIRFCSLRRTALVLAGVTLIGALLRAYRFEEWLLFNPDQARDAMTVYKMTEGSFPLLGPLAGGTEFHLGPITHYFSFLSGLIFGRTPAAFAYPDLIFSVLAIPLTYVLIAKMFSKNMGLASAFLMAISGFMVSYGRFQWNPNTMPFFILLFILSAQSVAYERENRRNRMVWAAALGISIGVGVQLHTFLLILLPILTLALFVFLIMTHSFSKRILIIVTTVALALNIPQFVSEFGNNFSNTNAFFSGADKKTGSIASQFRHIRQDSVCHIRSYAFILTALGNRSECDRFVSTFEKKAWRNPVDAIHAVLETAFLIGGLLLLVSFTRRSWKSGDQSRAFLLGFSMLYSCALFLLIIPVSNEMATRYFLADTLMPFVLFATWGTFLLERGEAYRWVVVLALILLVVSNGLFLFKEYRTFKNGQVSDDSVAVWGEIVPIVAFIDQYLDKGTVAYLTGSRGYRQRFSPAMRFSFLSKGKTVEQWNENTSSNQAGPIFSIQKRMKNFDTMTEIDGYKILDRIASGHVSVFLIQKYAE